LGKGIITELLIATLNYLFKEGFESISSSTFIENIASRKVLEKVGFIFNKYIDYWSYKYNRLMTLCNYEISKKNWNKLWRSR